MKIEKFSSYVMYACFIVILVVLAMFYFVGYTNPIAGDLNAPEHTDTLIFLMYGLLVLTILLTLIAAVMQFGAAFKDSPMGAIKSLMGLLFLVVVIVVSYALGSGEPVMANNELYTDALWLKLTDMFLNAMYILLGITALLTIVNMTGIVKKIKF